MVPGRLRLVPLAEVSKEKKKRVFFVEGERSRSRKNEKERQGSLKKALISLILPLLKKTAPNKTHW